MFTKKLFAITDMKTVKNLKTYELHFLPDE